MTLALLLTDLVDSTRLSEQLGDQAMAALWARHDRVARDLLVPHRGREIDKTHGFLLLFPTAADAVAYAVEYHRALGRLELKARAGLHVGPVILTENRPSDVARGAKPIEVDGLAKPMAARVMSLAVGGQTLLTAEALAALGPHAFRVESHGHWRIKGVAEPMELFEVGDDAAPFTPPPDGAKVYRVVHQDDRWMPARLVPHRLPAERDPFVGRVVDLQELTRRIDGGARLVSVLGAGGTGKTRLVVHYGWTWLGDWPGGVWFCDLAEARGVDGIVSAVARALDLPLDKTDPVVQLGHTIAGRGRCLVLLDNFEQVARDAPDTLGCWLDRATNATFVVTTREVLGLPGESTLALAPLGTTDALELFTVRAEQARHDFVLSQDDRPVVATLVKLLDGLPLAIELAAARVRLMSVQTLVQRMGERFKLLRSTGGRHTRQATLRGALDWSWDLLSSDEQQALAQVSVFEGGFTLEAAEAVLALSEAWPIDALQGLVDKSLLRRDPGERFDLLVSVHEYAGEQLDVLGGRQAAELRHGRYFARFGSDHALHALSGPGGAGRMRALGTELANLMGATRRAVARDDGGVAVDSLRAACAVLWLRGPPGVAAGLASEVLGMPSLAPSGARSRARGEVARLLGAALLGLGRGQEARACFDEALAAKDPRVEAEVKADLGLLHTVQGRVDEAWASYEAALLAARGVPAEMAPPPSFTGRVLGAQGGLRHEQGRMHEAHALYAEALAVHRGVGDRRGEGVVLGNLGNLYTDLGELDEARAHYAAALAAHREAGNRRSEGIVLGNLGILYTDQGRMDEALAHHDAALAVHREVGNRRFEGMVLGNLGNLHSDQGRMEEALAHYDAALAVHREVGNRRSEGIVLGNLGLLHLLQARYDLAGVQLDLALGVHRALGSRLFEGYVTCHQGRLLERQGRLDEALARFDAALVILREVGDRRFQGSVLGNLGTLHTAQGRPDEARQCFDAGEALLREASDRQHLGRLLAGRACLEQAVGRRDAALTALAEAQVLAIEAGAGPESDLGQALCTARGVLGVP